MLLLTNRFSPLPETELTGDVHPDIGRGAHYPSAKETLPQ